MSSANFIVQTNSFTFPVFQYSQLDSTQKEITLLVQTKEIEPPLVVWALSQTEGKGRKKKNSSRENWFSPSGNLYFSLALKDTSSTLSPLINFIPLLTLQQVLEKYSLNLHFKWPNDLLCSDKKMAGVLIQYHQALAIFGVGLNVSTSKFPPPLEKKATSIYLETNQKPNLENLLRNFLSQWDKWWQLFSSHPDQIREAWLEQNNTLGKKVTIINYKGEQLTGKAVNLSPEGFLIIKNEQGLITIREGELNYV